MFFDGAWSLVLEGNPSTWRVRGDKRERRVSIAIGKWEAHCCPLNPQGDDVCVHSYLDESSNHHPRCNTAPEATQRRESQASSGTGT